ncbi:ATP-binding protein [Georgenia sp. Z1344]|uniref:ATP-binding protein n=1 Tax=Georgenia sp. Z1344 TaxID=3416706 RepID=UPI003CF5B9CD
MEYTRRTVDAELDELMTLAPAIAIDGPKAVGKSATATRRADHSWFLDDPDQRELVAADLGLDGAPSGTLLLDEWQRLPAVWDSVRRKVDGGAPPGRFLLTGSASLDPASSVHSGAGRFISLRMRPMALHERWSDAPTVSLRALLSGTAGVLSGATDRVLPDYLGAIVESGFPGIRRGAERLRRARLEEYLDLVVERDLPELGHTVRRPATLRRWLSAYAAASSTTSSYSAILDAVTAGDGSQPAKTTTIAYREMLTRLWLLDPVSGWTHSRRPLSRVQQAPKHQLADPALAARLLGLTASSLGSGAGASMAGPLFESLATLGVRVAAQAAEARVGHLRTRNGDREVDLVVEGTDGQVVGIEVKLSSSVADTDVRHLLWLRDQLPEDVVDLVVLTTGRQAYRRRDGVAVVPLALLGA